MKIIMNDGNGHGMTFHIPYGLLLNRVVAGFAPKFLSRYGVDISKQQAKQLLVGLRLIKKDYRGLRLMEMESSHGEQLIIIV